jgi:hypothetical protein
MVKGFFEKNDVLKKRKNRMFRIAVNAIRWERWDAGGGDQRLKKPPEK